MKSLLIVVHLLLPVLSMWAQDNSCKMELSARFGVGETAVEKISEEENLDFLNYVNDYPDMVDLVTIKLGLKFDCYERMQIRLNIILMGDLYPDKFDIRTDYLLGNHFGLGIGSMMYTYYFNEFGSYYSSWEDEYYIRQHHISLDAYDLGFYISPSWFLINNDRLRLRINCDLGMASFLKEASSFDLKARYSNERQLHEYYTRLTFQPYIDPSLDIRLRLLKIKNSSLGLISHTHLFYSKRSIRYDRNILVWTDENSDFQTLKPPNHSFCRYEIDLGLYVSF